MDRTDYGPGNFPGNFAGRGSVNNKVVEVLRLRWIEGWFRGYGQ